MEDQTCIIVDDHPMVREGTRMFLERVAWLEIVGEASTGAGALQLVRRLRPTLALLDLRLPDLDGIALTSSIVSEHLSTRTVIFSGLGGITHVEHALAAGAHGYVLKTSGIELVVEALRFAAIGQNFVDPSLASDLLFPALPRLSPRELEILKLMSNGQQNGVIAFDLNISVDTVKAHVSKIFSKLDVDSRTEAVATALRSAMID